jgi:hypothetical protein
VGTAIPRSLDDVTPAWLGEVLDAPVDGVVIEPFDEGVGFIGRTVRARLSYAAGASGPDSVVVKLPADGPARALGVAMRMYEREVRFYRDVAPTVGITVPRCFAARMDEGAELFAIVLEDLAPARAGDQLVGATDDEAAAAVSTAADLHARWWADPALPAWGWLPSQAEVVAATVERAPALYPAFAEAWSGRLSDDELALGERVANGLGDLIGRVDHPPFTFVHGDYRLDNLFFPDGGGVVVADWQLVMRGYSGASDVALLLASSLTPDDRARLTSPLLDLYLDRLAAAGVEGYGATELRASLAVASAGLIARCPVAHQIPSANERAATMRARLVRGYWDLAAHTDLAALF